MIRRAGSLTRLSIQAPGLKFEKLEDRRLLASTLYVDFGFGFTDGQLAMNNSTSAALNGPMVFPGGHTIVSLTENLQQYKDIYPVDRDNNNIVSAAEAQLFATQVLTVVDRVLEPFDVTVRQIDSADVFGISDVLFSTANNDAYVVAAGFSDHDIDHANCGGSCEAPGWAVTDAGNLEDNVGFAFLGEVLGDFGTEAGNSDDPLQFALRMCARNILHQAGHTWGLRDVDGQASELLTRSSVMGVGENTTWGEDFSFFTRYTVPTHAVGSGTQNSFDLMSSNVGLRPDSPFYVTGTGAADRITINSAGAGKVNIVVRPHVDDFQYSIVAGPPLYLLDQEVPNGIVVEAGFAADLIEVLPFVTATIEVRGGDSLNPGAPRGDTLVGPNVANDWILDGRQSGQLNSHVMFSEIRRLEGGVQVDTFVSYAGSSDITPSGGNGNDVFHIAAGMLNTVSGDDGDDLIILDGGQVLYGIDGELGHDTLDLSNLGSQSIHLGEFIQFIEEGFNGSLSTGEHFDGINEIIGSNAGTDDEIRGLDRDSVWTIDNNSHTYATGGRTLYFSNFEVVNGRDQADLFSVRATSAPIELRGHDGDDVFALSSGGLDGNVSSLYGTVVVDGGSGLSHLAVVDTSGSDNHDVVITSNSITGIAPAEIVYTGDVFDVPGTSRGVWILGADGEPDHITIESFLATNTLKIETQGGDDTIDSRGTLPANIMLDGGEESDQYVIEWANQPHVVMTGDSGQTGFDKLTVIGLPGGNNIVSRPGSLTRGSEQILYGDNIELLDLRTGNGIDELTINGASAHDMRVWTGADADRVTINDTTGLHSLYVRTKSGKDRVFVNRTHAGTLMTTIHTGTAGDYIYVGSTAHADNGNLSRIQGRVTAIGGGNSDGEDRLYINDHGATGPYDYRVHPGWVVNLPDDDSPDRPEFAGIRYDGSMEVLRLDGTDQQNTFEVVPSFDTRYMINGNGGNDDFLRLDVDPNSGRYLHMLDRNAGSGYWSFTNGFQPVHFPNFRLLDHVARLAVGADANNVHDGGSMVRVYDAETRTFLFDFYAYEPSFRGGVRVATGDINADGIPDIVTAPGRTHSPLVRVFDGLDGSFITEFMAYDPDYVGGVNIATGHVVGIIGTDIVTAPTRDSSEVRVFRNNGGGNSFTLVDSFDAYEPDFIGGVSVAVADINGDNNDDIITGSGSGRVAQVAVFDGLVGGGAQLYRFQLLGSDHLGGIFVAAGDMDGDGLADVIVGTGTNNTYNDKFNSLVHVYLNPALINLPTVFNTPQFEMQAFADPAHNLRAPIHLTVKDYDLDGVIDELFTSQGPDGKSLATHVFASLSPLLIDTIFELDPEFSDGHYVG